MSKKPLTLCLFLLSAAVASHLALGQDASNDAVKNADHVHARIPLGKAIGRTAANEAKNPQSEGLANANERVTENQARFIEKHVDRPVASDGVQRPERVERVERAERPERVERAERPERVERPQRAERPERPERPARADIGRPERPDHAGMGRGR
jgi:hypothetical protein